MVKERKKRELKNYTYRGMSMTNEPIKKLKHYNARLTTVLNELAVLEDYENADYTDVVTDIAYSVRMLENRRETLQRRGRRL